MDLLVRAEKMDLLSNLPDDVLLRILSFLTTKQAALTSVLSKRWRNLSVLAPNLDIRDSLLRYREAPFEERGHIRQLFMDFVDKVFALRGNSPIKRFSLTFIIVDSDRVGAWIRNVLVREVSELELSMPSIHYCRRYDFDICWLDGRKYPMLKTLVLDSVSLSVDRFENLLHALPALEELVLRYIYWKSRNGFHLIVSSACLKTLTIYSFECYLDTYTFDTPSLVNFCYSDYGSQDYSVAKMENLLEAQIRLLVPEDEIKRARVDLHGNLVLRFASVGKLMNVIRNVQYLNICAVTLKVLSLCCESMPVFNNLESLTIESNKNQGFQGTMKELRMIKHFLVYLPCLKEIKICIEGNGLEHIRVPEMSEAIAEMIELNNKLSSCNVQLLVNGCLYKKWTAQ